MKSGAFDAFHLRIMQELVGRDGIRHSQQDVMPLGSEFLHNRLQAQQMSKVGPQLPDDQYPQRPGC